MQIPRRVLFGKLNTPLFSAIEAATAFAKLKGHAYVELLHWLYQIWQIPNGDMRLVLLAHGTHEAQLDQDFIQAIQKLNQQDGGLHDFSVQIERVIEKAWSFSTLCCGDHKIRGAWLLSAMLADPQARATLQAISPQLLKWPHNVDADSLRSQLKASSEDQAKAFDQGSSGDLNAPSNGNDEFTPHSAEQSALKRYCTDLTSLAERGDIDPVMGREHEVRTLVDILLRRRQNNPLLTGSAGVGKTAVVEGLALSIVQRKVPPALQHVRLLSLDVGSLLAGASMRGEFESRLKQLLKEASESATPVILFIDEVHTLVGAGGQSGTADAANLLKPALARGGLRCIGATTWSEYKKYIEKDPALTRRFQVLQVHEPEEDQAITMVRSLVPAFVHHHKVVVLDEAIRAAVTLSHRYIPARQLPDKAVSLLDTACARVAMSLHAPPRALQECDAQIQDQQAQLEMLRHEATAGLQNDTAIHAVEQRLRELQQKQAQIQDRWAKEKSVVEAMVSLWQPAEQQDSEETLESLAALQARLQIIQEDQPEIHPVVSAAVVASIVSDWTGIPVGRMLRNELKAIEDLQSTLEKRVIGQSAALAQIVERVRIAKAGLTDPGKPMGVFMLVGPSGVGKTETALALAESIYGGEHNLITINMSEYQESHTVSSLKGAPPGYVGYGEGGVLTEAVRRRPYSVILLDEVEKAHPDVHELFYQVFDKGWMEDGEGQVIDFKNTLILLTSNTGSDLTLQLCDDPAVQPDSQALAQALEPELRKVFPAAFLGRISVVPYYPLSTSVLSELAQLQLQKIVHRMYQQHGIELTYTPPVIAQIVAASGMHETGGRRIAQHIERLILPKLANVWLGAMRENMLTQKLQLDLDEKSAYVVHVRDGGPGGHDTKNQSTSVIENI
ncbi:type VI secretion system ATPase TssH [Limnohabitans sp. Jir72]|uniref:type VI secretion system ATPase TssH n=1 Tax=Limnohabitans sp. Jir72 TaxID=1977909 RepID=UPI000D3749F9|nr:type VI secretion system ATPase TssH [Limnohabitans sp. Jir72]PUE28966.1 ClpV1 family T6SS ATPase [Limnohabitans sp. Jir72]